MTDPSYNAMNIVIQTNNVHFPHSPLVMAKINQANR